MQTDLQMKFTDPAVHGCTKIEARSDRFPAEDGGDAFTHLELTFTGLRNGRCALSIYLPFESAVYAAQIAQAINGVNAD